jgi:hypothetical protein
VRTGLVLRRDHLVGAGGVLDVDLVEGEVVGDHELVRIHDALRGRTQVGVLLLHYVAAIVVVRVRVVHHRV